MAKKIIKRPVIKHRRLIYSPDILKKIKELIGIGYPQTMICEVIGVKPSALSQAKKRNNKLREVFTRGRADFIQHHLTNIETHAIKDWRASKYQLEIHDPEHFSERRKLELTGKDGQPVGVVVVKNYGGKKK